MAEVTSINHLPNDTVRCILSRLPVETLLELRYVSKSWEATISAAISDPAFVKAHLEHQHTDSYNLFVRKLTILDHSRMTYDFSLMRASDDDDEFQLQSSLVSSRPGFNDVLCTCDGVMLLTADPRHSYKAHTAFMLWNPSTNKKATFLCPYKFQHNPAKHGMCHDPVTGEFKVVIAWNEHYAVYSCKNNLWSELRDFRYSCETGDNEGLFVDGVIYWVVLDEEVPRSREIIYFDPSDDGFKKVEKPIHGNINENFDLVVLRGCLCLYTYDEGEVRIWIKEEGKDKMVWTELMIIETESEEEDDIWFRPICSLENDKILLNMENEGFVVYNPSEKTFGEYFDYSFEYSYLHIQMFPCKETLLFPLENIRRPKRKRSKPLMY